MASVLKLWLKNGGKHGVHFELIEELLRNTSKVYEITYANKVAAWRYADCDISSQILSFCEKF